jgi:hypothetical protein
MAKLELFRLADRGSELQRAWQHAHRYLLKLKSAIDSSEAMADPNEPAEGDEIHSVLGLETDSSLPQVWLKLQNGFSINSPREV